MLDAIYEQGSAEDELKRITFNIFRFQRLPEDEIEALRQCLFCPACGGRSYYRKASKDGKAACFGSRYHQADCPEFNPSAQKSREEQDALEVARQLVDAEALVIDFNLKVPSHRQNTHSATHSADAPATQTKRAFSRQNNTANISVQADRRVASQGLDKLLHSLLRGSDLASSDVWIYTDEARKYRWRAKNLFVNFAKADPSDGKPHLFWGTISHSDASMNWLNPADCKDVGIPIDGINAKLFAQFAIDDRRDLEGAGLMLFGKCFWNKDKSRKIIQLWNKDLKRIVISPLED